MKRIFYLLLIALLPAFGYSQEAYKLKAALTDALIENILQNADSLFGYNANFAINLSTRHVYAYKYIEEEKMLAPDYADTQLKLLEKSPGNAMLYNNIALYYQRKGDTLLAANYYRKALANHKLLPKAKDSAFYYSFRGLIKHNLKQDGITDIEKALSINKADSVAIAFYPMLLMGKGDFTKAKSILINALQAKKDNYSAYLFLVVSDFYQKIMTSQTGTEEEAKKIRDNDLGKIMDLDMYDKYISRDDRLFRQIKEMGEVFSVFIKFSEGLKDKSWQPRKEDADFVAKKEKYFKQLAGSKEVNAFGIYMSLGNLSFLQKRFIQAEQYYMKAIEVFPKEKETYEFNTIECYDNLAASYYMEKKYDKAIEASTAALAVKSLDKEKKKALLTGIARLNAEKGDYDKANDIALSVNEMGESFENNFLLSYISAKSKVAVLGQRYLEKAQQLVVNEEQFCDMLTYITVFHLINGQFDEARSFFDGNKSQLVGEKCDKCEKLLTKYLIANE
jgi:tetratricopeptide (TPR) repeat protein